MNQRHPAAKPPLTEEDLRTLRHVVARGEDRPAFATGSRGALSHLENAGLIRFVGSLPGYGSKWYLFRSTEAGILEVQG